jgi:hypothetical protein
MAGLYHKNNYFNSFWLGIEPKLETGRFPPHFSRISHGTHLILEILSRKMGEN